MRRVLFLVLMLLALGSPSGFGQNSLIVLEKVVLARSLVGRVVVGEETAADNVTVDLCGPDWRTVIASTKTDRDGYFSFKTSEQKTWWVRISAEGINTMELRVRTNKHAAQDLIIRAVIAT
jgi:hypothetical protein